MGCATTTIKFVVFLFNTLCACLGIITIVLAALALKSVPDDADLLIILIIVVGSIVFVISFFGCCGAIKENVCMTATYAAFMLILLVANCVLVFVYMRDVNYHNIAAEQLEINWKDELNGTHAMDSIQKQLQCCGVQGPQDYGKANKSIPLSCYKNDNKTDVAFKSGCLDALVYLLNDTTSYVKIFSYVSIGVEGVAFIAACILAVTFNNLNRRLRY